MNKGIKYILGFAVIFVAAVVCVFGIIKYEEMQEDSTTNNSANLGSVDGKQLDKETTIVIEKISTLNDIDALNSELHLSQAVVDILKKYAPTVNYAIDNSEGYDKIYFRIGGYYTGNNTNGIDEIIGSYKIDGGKLISTGDNLGSIGSKINGNNKLKWNNLNLNNKEHDKVVAGEIGKQFLVALLGGKGLNMTSVFGYLADQSKKITPPRGSQVTSIVSRSLPELVDLYNAAYKEIYTEEQVKKEVSKYTNKYKEIYTEEQVKKEVSKYTNKYKEIDDSFSGNESKYSASINIGELLYFKKDKMYVVGMGGIGGLMTLDLSPQNEWTTEGDKITIPLVNTFERGKPAGKIVLRLNNKKYDGGQSKFKYYVESISK